MNADFSRPFTLKAQNFSSFDKIVSSSISSFVQENPMVNLIEKKSLTISVYHKLLINIFHQVYNSSGSFALAGSMCNTSLHMAREYLFHHAEEEMTHWQWILEDLKSTGYQGEDPRDLPPSVDASAYLSYGYYLALKFPVGRLAMALVLEGISGAFGLKYGRVVLEQLKLRPDQAKFFLAHGELDQGHEKDIMKVLSASNLSENDYAQMSVVATTTVALYKRLYNFQP